MSWHYRILRYKDGGYGLHEVYESIEDKLDLSWTLQPIEFVCDEDEGPESIIEALSMAMNDAKLRPVLDIDQTWEELCKEAHKQWSGTQ